MRRFWLERPQWENDEVAITGDLFHHLRDVCRFDQGDKFEVIAAGQAWLVEVLAVSGRSLTLKRLEARRIPELARPHLHLALSVPRFAKVDWIVEKSVELGVKALHPFVSDFSFVREKARVPAAKIERWKKLTKQAAQQSGRGELMEIAPVSTLNELLNTINQRPRILCLFPYEGECELTLKERLKGLSANDFEEIWVFIGSEGGFSRSEVEHFRSLGMAPVSLGQQVLRVETACVALASILKYEFGALN